MASPEAEATLTLSTIVASGETAERGTPRLPDRFLMTGEAARYLRLSPRTLERLRVSGEGPRFLKAGPGKRARVLYVESDLEAWLGKFRYASTSEYCLPE